MATEEPNPSILKPINSPQEQWSGGASGAFSCFPSPGKCFFLALHMAHGLKTVSTAAPCFTLLHALKVLHCPRNPRDLQIIREKFEWTGVHILDLQFMLILARFDQKFLCQQAYLVTFREANSITKDSMKTLHFKVLFYKCVAESFPIHPYFPCSNNRASEQHGAVLLVSVICLSGRQRAGGLAALCYVLLPEHKGVFLIPILHCNTCIETG